MLLRIRPHRVWYQGRAAAESLKTLSWRYAVGGRPFAVGTGDPAPAFRRQAREVVDELSDLGTPAGEDPFAPTPSMEALRASRFELRRDAYLTGRIRDQLEWYGGKARWNRALARFWAGVVIFLQVLGAVGAFLTGFGMIRLELFGLAAAVAAAAAAWLETKQHASLASAYRVAADELARIETLLPSGEEEWARFVAEAEDGISREHTTWRAKVTDTRPVPLA
jgi:hypothetical protein